MTAVVRARSMVARRAGRTTGSGSGSGSGGGQRRPSARRPAPAFYLLAGVIVVLNLIGLVMVLSASSVSALQDFGTPWYYLERQAMWVGLGTLALLVVQRIDYRVWRRFATPGLLVSYLLLLAVFVPGVGVNNYGSNRWVALGPVQFQPAELAKIAVLVFSADLLARRLRRIQETRVTVRPVMVVTGVAVALLMAQPDLGTTIVLASIVLVVLFAAGAPLGRLAGLFVAGASLASLMALAVPWRRARILAFLDPWADPLKNGYQIIQSMVAIASGGVTGLGVGAGRSKWGFLPFAHTDFIFAVIAEEFGLVGAVTVIFLFVVLGLLGIRTAVRAPDAFGMLLAAGITSWLLVQAIVNIGAAIGVLPITGITLPFVSFGGTSLVASMAAAGLLLSVARRAG